MVFGQDCNQCKVDGARLGFFVLQDTELCPCFVGTGIVMEKENVLGGGDWVLAAELPDDFRQNCFCII